MENNPQIYELEHVLADAASHDPYEFIFNTAHVTTAKWVAKRRLTAVRFFLTLTMPQPIEAAAAAAASQRQRPGYFIGRKLLNTSELFALLRFSIAFRVSDMAACARLCDFRWRIYSSEHQTDSV